MPISPIGSFNGGLYGDHGDSSLHVKSDEAIKNPSVLENSEAKTTGVKIDDFSQKFDLNGNGQMDKAEINNLGKYASKITQETNEEVHIGVSRTGDGDLEAKITTGTNDSVEPVYPEGTPVFSGHTHPSGSLSASGADKSTKIENGPNAIWNPENGDTAYY